MCPVERRGLSTGRIRVSSLRFYCYYSTTLLTTSTSLPVMPNSREASHTGANTWAQEGGGKAAQFRVACNFRMTQEDLRFKRRSPSDTKTPYMFR